MEHTIIFQPSGRRATVPHGTTILNAARKLGVGIEAVCGDNLTCGKCKVKIMEGDFPKEGIKSSLSHVSRIAEKDKKVIVDLTAQISAAKSDDERTKLERKLAKIKKKHAELASEEIDENIRMACATKVMGDILVFVPEGSRIGETIVSKAAGKINVVIDPAVKKYYLELTPPELSDPVGDLERIEVALKEHKIENITIDYSVLQQVPDTLRNADWKVTVTVLYNREVIRIEPGKSETNVGIAVDIGTTTVAGYLTDLDTGEVLVTESMMNPQVSFGEDVMSRITYCLLNEQTGIKELQQTIITGLNTIIKNATEKIGIATHDVSEIVIVGNTAMHHLLLGINPEYVGAAPFAPAVHKSVDVKAERMGIDILPSGNVHVLPIEAGFVGADNVGCLIADRPYDRDEFTLLIDIGTNGELVFGNRDKLISCSTATGPALEGGEITFGIRATPGAIERVKIDHETLEPTFQVIGSDRWSDGKEDMGARGICGSAIIDVIAEMFKAGIILKSGQFNKELKSPRIREREKGISEYVLAWAHETAIEEDIYVNIKDVRAIQLAKGSLYSGCEIMMKKLGKETFDRLAICGAFGSHIDKMQAMVMGMYPDCDPDKIEYLGNAAGDGARVALLSVDARCEANDIARKVEYVELALEEDFNDRFGEAMQFPHMFNKFPHTEHLIAKREAKTKAD